jgi:hypothetical protein
MYVACFNNLWLIISFLGCKQQTSEAVESERKVNEEEKGNLQTRNNELQQ